MICQVCKREFDTNMSLARHIRFHGITTKEYYDRYLRQDSEGICICCGKPTRFINFTVGYQKTCSNECAVKSGLRGSAIRDSKKVKIVYDTPVHITPDSNIDGYSGKQRVTFNCLGCGKECSSRVQTVRSAQFNNEFYCQRCKKLKHIGKIYLPNERIFVDENTDLNRYIVKQPVQFYCKNCGRNQTASILYLRQTRNVDKFLCQKCSYEKYILEHYGISVAEFQNKSGKSYYSKMSKDFFDKLPKNDHEVYYADNEFGLYDKLNGCYYKYDYVDYTVKKIIEFNGNCFHPKSQFDENFRNPFDSSVTAETAWKKDRQKENCAVSNGYKILYIWEDELYEDYTAAVDKCINFLKD